uniref:Ribosomal protein S7 domain-containing protein n=1 Tax=Romanomermis culicivorax TaxID=13658 RepID=A0A915J179_ROMCU
MFVGHSPKKITLFFPMVYCITQQIFENFFKLKSVNKFNCSEMEIEENQGAVVAENPDIQLFGRWTLDTIDVNDMSLVDYIAVKDKHAKYLPHSAGRYQVKRFRKAQCPVVERLVCSLMMHGRNNGKKLMTMRIVKNAFEIIHLLTGENPVQILVNAIINSGPREDSTRIGRAGTVRRQAVDVSPLRRVNQAIWLLCTGAREAAFRNVKTIAECLADELINAAKGSSNSYAIKKKDELERVAKSNR